MCYIYELLVTSKSNIRLVLNTNVIIMIVLLLLMLYRVSMGIVFADESWHIADPYYVAKGAVPYIDNWSQAPGTALPVFLLYKLFLFFNGGTVGIVIFARILYIIWSFSLAVGLFFLIKNYLYKSCPFLFFLAIPLLYGSGYSLNYSTIGLIYLSVVVVLLYIAKIHPRKQKMISIIAGIIIGRAIIGTPFVIIAWLATILCLIIKHEKKILLYYCLGNLIAAFLVIAISILVCGVEMFIQGFEGCVATLTYTQITSRSDYASKIDTIIDCIKPFIIFLALGIALNYYIKDIKTRNQKIIYSLLLSLCIGFLLSIHANSITPFVKFGWFIPIVMYMFYSNKKRITTVCLMVMICYFLVYSFSAYIDIWNGFRNRQFWLIIPVIIGGIELEILGRKYFCSKKWVYKLTAILLILSLVALHYRDRDLEVSNFQTSKRIEYGIWKGCYTTPDRADSVIELEKYIKEITSEEDDVLFLDWVSFAYLMSNGNVCSPSTMDSMAYSYFVNNPQIMYKYYKIHNVAPEKIIYISYGRDKVLSIEDERWKFNEFVYENYEQFDVYRNETFKVLAYKIKDKYRALDFIKSKTE